MVLQYRAAISALQLPPYTHCYSPTILTLGWYLPPADLHRTTYRTLAARSPKRTATAPS